MTNILIILRGHPVLGEHGVQEGTKHAPLRGPHVEGQRNGCVADYHHHLGAAPIRKSRIQLQREVLNPRIRSLVMSIGKTLRC